MTAEQIIEQASAIPSWTSVAERMEVLKQAEKVQPGGQIVEIGGLYGGMTAVMGLANPEARITVVDEFSWHPIKGRPASEEELMRNVHLVGVTNVSVIAEDSREVGKAWDQPIDFLWIDGGHSYEYVKSDLDHFGPHAQVIACHDWDNPFWPDIRHAVEDFIAENPEWEVSHNAEMVVVLVRKKEG